MNLPTPDPGGRHPAGRGEARRAPGRGFGSAIAPRRGVIIDVLLGADTERRALQELREGLLQTPRNTSPRFFYDDAGSRLFERITGLAEYYQTRTEASILARIAPEVIAHTGARELVELGSGAAEKTRLLLDAMSAAGELRHYVPFDVSEEIVRRAAAQLVDDYDGLQVHGFIGEFTEHLESIPKLEKRLLIFLGGTIGNFDRRAALEFLSRLASAMEPGEHLLLGFDLIKDPARLEAAYNDAHGITAEFNRNALRVLNRFARADFDPHAFTHRAIYNAAEHRIEMWLDADRAQAAHLHRLGMTLVFGTGDSIRTEISVKYDRALAEALLREARLEPVAWYTDPDALFALALARRPGRAREDAPANGRM